jgi:SAM-dependent methyltransferase
MSVMPRLNTEPFDWRGAPSDYAAAYDHLDGKYRSLYTRSARALACLAGVRAGMTAVDLGCGTGISASVLLEEIGAAGRIYGIDVSQAMLDRARAKLTRRANVTLFKHDACSIHELASRLGIAGSVDLVFCNFAYFYLSDRRDVLHRRVHAALAPGGRWAFNVTPYLVPVVLNGRVFNGFAALFQRRVETLLRRTGTSPVRARTPKATLSPDVASLREAGFSAVRVEPFQLPLTPSQAYLFTARGFYQHGILPSFSEALGRISLEQRMDLLEEARRGLRRKLDSTGERPTIFNVVAVK